MNELKSNRPYDEDLEKWLWTTKGVRFLVHERYLRQNKWSNISLGLMSFYIILINLVPFYNINIGINFDTNTISFYSTALSILILLFSQLENSNDFKLKAEKFHSCALEISELYRQLREFVNSGLSTHELASKLTKLTNDYHHILSRYENHKNIDYRYFMVRHSNDFKINRIDAIYISIKYYLNTLFIYHFLIIVPVLFFFIK